MQYHRHELCFIAWFNIKSEIVMLIVRFYSKKRRRIET